MYMNALRVETCMLYMYFKETSLISHASLESSNKESFNQSADYWLADYPELRRTTQPSTIGGPLGEPRFCIFCSTAMVLVYWPISSQYSKLSTIRVNSLWFSDATWGHRTWSTLVQVMACCLMATSHYLNQYWPTIWFHTRFLSNQSL